MNQNAAENDPTSKDDKRMIVVAIGASAGGLRPLQELFDLLPSDTDMCFVVVQHLSPDFDSVMDELLAKQTDMPIKVIREGMTLEPNVLYLNPPRFNAQVFEGSFMLSDFSEDELRLPINAMFHSIASQFGSDSVGVVLSGTGSDGASGIKSIHQMEGLTIVQSLATAQFDGMPVNAIATDAVDYILSPSAIAQLLAEHAVAPVLRTSDRAVEELASLSGVQLIFSLLSARYGINFAHYKPTTVARRIDRRLKLSRYGSLLEYSEVLRDDEDELDLLYHDLLIGVTKFFRDPEAFEILRQELSTAVDALAEDKQLRVWSVGCASGEEAYSIAMTLWMLFEQRDRSPDFKVFATDVHDRILEFASRGIYVIDEIEGLSPELQEKFFIPHDEKHIKILPRLRNQLVFAKQNVVNDPPFTRMDLVTCRNLLIYLQDDAQTAAISGFRFAMRPGALMMLGPSETVGKLSDGFDVIDKSWRLFRKNSSSRHALHSGRSLVRRSVGPKEADTLQLVQAEGRNIRMSEVSNLLLSEFLSCALLLDSKRNILHVFGRAKIYLQAKKAVSDGDSKKENVLDFFNGETGAAIASILIQALNSLGAEFVTRDIDIPVGDDSHTVDIKVKAFARSSGDPPVVLLQFQKRSARYKDSDIDDDSDLTPESRQILSVELANTRESLGTTIEELEASNEELQAANEEMIASNEELQATNEELQSVNEELHTVNIEHQKKVIELEEMTDDFNNLFNSTEVGSILLDDNLCIRKFTPMAKNYFNLMDHDIGRPLTNFASQVRIEDLSAIIREVKETRDSFLAFAKDNRDHWVSVKIAPYQSGQRINGVIINMTDLTPATTAIEECTSDLSIRAGDAVWNWEKSSDRLWLSKQFRQLVGLSDDVENSNWQTFLSIFNAEDQDSITPEHMQSNSVNRFRRFRLRESNGVDQEFEIRWRCQMDEGHLLQSISGTLSKVDANEAATDTQHVIYDDSGRKRRTENASS